MLLIPIDMTVFFSNLNKIIIIKNLLDDGLSVTVSNNKSLLLKLVT